MSDSKEQKIVVFTGLNKEDNGLILNGIKIASLFKKELCLVYNYKKREKKEYQILKTKLQQYALKIQEDLPGLKTSSLLLSENMEDLPDVLSDDYEGILFVANALQYKEYTKALAESSVPILFARPDSSILDFNRLVQTMDFRKENSDASLWSSYFGRFNKAELVVVAAKDKQKSNQRAVIRNLELTKKLYTKFDIHHKVYRGTKSSFRNVFETLDFALASDCNLMVMLGSSAITPLDRIIGLPEEKIIKKAGNLPVLVINPRKDNYIMCD